MVQYLELLRHVLEKGERKEDRTGTGTISVFGAQFSIGTVLRISLTNSTDMRSSLGVMK